MKTQAVITIFYLLFVKHLVPSAGIDFKKGTDLSQEANNLCQTDRAIQS